MCSNVPSDLLPIYIKAMWLVLAIFNMVKYILDKSLNRTRFDKSNKFSIKIISANLQNFTGSKYVLWCLLSFVSTRRDISLLILTCQWDGLILWTLWLKQITTIGISICSSFCLYISIFRPIFNIELQQ